MSRPVIFILRFSVTMLRVLRMPVAPLRFWLCALFLRAIVYQYAVMCKPKNKPGRVSSEGGSEGRCSSESGARGGEDVQSPKSKVQGSNPGRAGARPPQ